MQPHKAQAACSPGPVAEDSSKDEANNSKTPVPAASGVCVVWQVGTTQSQPQVYNGRLNAAIEIPLAEVALEPVEDILLMMLAEDIFISGYEHLQGNSSLGEVHTDQSLGCALKGG